MGPAPRRGVRRDHPQPAALPAGEGGLRRARRAPTSTRQQQRVVTRLYESLVRRGANLNAEQKQQLSGYNQQLARLFAAVQREGAGRREHPHRRDRGRARRRPRRREGGRRRRGARAQPAGRPVRDRQHPLGGRSDPDLRRQPRAARARLARLRQPRRQWRRQRHQRDDRARSSGVRAERARLLGFANHAHWRMQDTMAAHARARAQELMMRVWPAAVARVREEVARAAGDGPPARPQHHDRAVGLSLLHGEDPQERFNLSQDEIKPYFELDNMTQGMFHMAGQLYGLQFREITGQVPVWHPDIERVARHQPRRRGCRRLLRGQFRAHRQALGRLGDHLSQPLGPARRRHRARLEQQQFRQARGRPAGADQPRRRRDPVPRVRPRHPLFPVGRALSEPRRHAARLRRISEPGARELGADAGDPQPLRAALPDRPADAAGAGRADPAVVDVQPGLRDGRISRPRPWSTWRCTSGPTASPIPTRSSARR